MKRPIKTVCFTCLVFCFAALNTASALETLYVSHKGNDSWSGMLPQPNADNTDGPFATLERARDEIRKRKKSDGLPKGGVVVELVEGVYRRDRVFELTAEDSASRESPVVFRAREGAVVRLSGGKRVSGFEPVAGSEAHHRLDPAVRGHVLQADLRAQGIVDFGELMPRGFGRPMHAAALELFFRNKPMTLARWPNEGFAKIARVLEGKDSGKFGYEGDQPKNWENEEEIWIHGYWFHDWADSYEKIRSIDTANRVLFTHPPHGVYGYKKGQRYYALNLLSELDRPGEWYLDRASGTLYFWPPDPVGDHDAEVTRLLTLISANESSYITLQGLTLEATRGTAVEIRNSTNVRLVGCTLRNIGNRAVSISGGTGCGVIGCEILETGDGAVSLSGGDRKSLVPAGNLAENNHIHDYSRCCRTYRPAIAVHGVGNRVAQNLIHDGPHCAILLNGNDHLIELNEVHHVCCETGDVGAFYMGRDWTARGTVIRHNFFHHIHGPGRLGAMGVYLDDSASGITVLGNVFYDVTRAAFIGGGRDNIIDNNIFIDCEPAVHIDARGLGWMSYHVEEGGTLPERLKAVPYTKPPWSDRYPRLVNILEDEPGAPKGNRIIQNICFGGRWLDMEEKASAYQVFENNMIDVDPRFVDAKNMDFRLLQESPAYKTIGFQRIPFEKIGPCMDR